MKDTSRISPPRWATRFLAWYCKPALLEDLEGDLYEFFQRNVEEKGVRWAYVIYVLDVFKFFRFYTIRKPQFLNPLIQSIMIHSYIRTSGRSLVRNKLFSTINIVGLAISMSVGLLMIAMIMDLLSYDKFHEKHDRIYRLISQHQYDGKKDNDFNATTSLKAAKAVKETFTGVEDVAVLHRDFSGDATFGAKTLPLTGLWANESFFNVFSFPLLQGNPSSALKNPFSVVLTEKSARKLFGDMNVLGRVLTLRDGKDVAANRAERTYTVTGVMKDIPTFSHMKFEMLGSLSTRETTESANAREMAWDNVWNAWAYVLLPDGGRPQDLKANLAKLSEVENAKVANIEIAHDLQPLREIMTGENLSNQIGTTMGGTVVWVFGSLCFIVILSAGLNYTNLSIARSIRRSREVGIRKTIGAGKGHVINQFIIESVMIALLALVFSFGLFMLIRPHFLSIESSLQELLVLDLSPLLIITFVVFAIVVGIFAGFFPALFYSRISAVQVFRKVSAIPHLKGLTMRKVLVVFQYCISIMAISATLIIYKQYKHFVAFDLGFTTENILNIRLQGNKPELLIKRLSELPEVKEISQSAIITSVGSYWGCTLKNPNDPHDSSMVYYNFIDENYLPLHNHRLIAGENFNGAVDNKNESQVIVNEEVLRRFDIADRDPRKAVGEVVEVDGKRLTIIGVLKDFSYGQANNLTRNEVIMRYAPEQARFLNVMILSADWTETYAKIESMWKEVDSVHPLEATFYDEQIERAFQGFRASMKVGSFLAIVIICIASIGLLGMVVYSTEVRMREVSIRKVFGASEIRLLLLLSHGFLLLLFIAAAISLPATFLFFDRVLLPRIANHASIGMFEMFSGVLAILVIALLMIGSETLKAARANPAEVLKSE